MIPDFRWPDAPPRRRSRRPQRGTTTRSPGPTTPSAKLGSRCRASGSSASPGRRRWPSPLGRSSDSEPLSVVNTDGSVRLCPSGGFRLSPMRGCGGGGSIGAPKGRIAWPPSPRKPIRRREPGTLATLVPLHWSPSWRPLPSASWRVAAEASAPAAAAQVPQRPTPRPSTRSSARCTSSPTSGRFPQGERSSPSANIGTVMHEMVVVKTDTPAGQLPTNAAGEASEKGAGG